MGRRTYEVEKAILTVKDGLLSASIDLSELADSLNEESQEAFADAICWDWVMDAALRRLTGNGYLWSGGDGRMTAEVLARMEAFAGRNVKYHVLANLDEFAKNLACHHHIYWTLWHSTDIPDGRGGMRGGADWLQRHEIESNHTTDLPSPKELMDYVQKRIDEALEPSTAPDEALIARIGQVLVDNGCDCTCGDEPGTHDDDCEICLACRVEAAMQPEASDATTAD